MDEEIEVQVINKFNSIKNEYNKKLISMQFYAAFLDKYCGWVQQEGEEDITSFIGTHVSLLVDQSNGAKPDAEFQDYFLAYVACYIYDYEIVDKEAIADLIMRRFNEYKILYIDEGKPFEEAWKTCFVEEYKMSDELSYNLGPSYKNLSTKVYKDAINYIKDYSWYLACYTMLEDEQIEQIIDQIFTRSNTEFRALFENEVTQVFMKYDKDKYKLSIPNLLMGAVNLFINWQNEHIVVVNDDQTN